MIKFLFALDLFFEAIPANRCNLFLFKEKSKRIFTFIGAS